MLPRPDAPAKRLPYTTADMSERLAKRKAEQEAAAQAKANQAFRTGVTNPPAVKKDEPWYKDVAGAIGGAAKTGLGGLAGMVNTVVATPLDIADEAVQGLERLVGVKPTDKFDPASMGSFNLFGETYRAIDNAANYTAGTIAAIPGAGKPSSSPFMDRVRSSGWAEALAEPVVHAVNVGSVAYPASKMAVGAKFPETIANAYRQRLLERDIAAQNNLFPAVQRPANVIDVDALQGSRLPARIVDAPPVQTPAPSTPTSPATRLAQAQTTRALPPSLQRALPPANIPKPGMVIPDSLAGIRDLPTLPSQLNFADFQSMPEYQQYLQAGQQLPTAKELADFGFDPERAYMVHSGAGDLTGNVLDPNFTGRANPEVAALNNTQLQNVIAKTTRANAYVDELSKGLEEFNRTGIWNGEKIGNNISNRIKDYFTRLDFVDELALNENLTAAQLGQANTQRFIDRLNRIINSENSYLDTFQQPANLAQQGNFLSMYPASVGTHNGYLFGEQPTTYLVGPNTNQITQGLGPGVFEPTTQVNVPEYQVFGQQSPLASINYQPQFRPSLDQMAAARAFFLRKVIEDRIARGLYEPTVAPTAPSAQLSQPAFRERKVPESTNITVQTSGNPDIQKRQTFTIRAFDKGFNDFKGVLTMYWDPDLQKAVVSELAASSPMVTPQLISSAAYLIRKTYGDIPFPIEPSTNLSAYSRPFVERLQQAGLVDPSYYLPPKESINMVDRGTTPYDISDPDTRGQKVIPPLAYQPTYNEVLKALVESKRRAKLQGEYGRLTTPSTKLAPKRNSLINEDEIVQGEFNQILNFEEPPNIYQQQFSTVEQARNDAVLNDIEEPAALKPLDNNELQDLVNQIYSVPEFMAMELIKYAKQNDSATDLFDAVKDIPGYLERMGLINESHKNRLTTGLDRQFALINGPVRIAEFIRNNVDPNNPLLKYYLDQYGSIENFATSDESFNMMAFMRPFYGQEPL